MAVVRWDMKSVGLGVVLGLVAYAGLGTDVRAQTAAECATQADIIQRFADYRMEGVNRNRAERLIRRALADHAQKYVPALPHMADFVYMSVGETQLDDQVGEVFRAQCVEALPKLGN